MKDLLKAFLAFFKDFSFTSHDQNMKPGSDSIFHLLLILLVKGLLKIIVLAIFTTSILAGVAIYYLATVLETI